MAASGVPERRLTVVDASVLINFLGLKRFELLTELPREFVITAEVNGQIKRNRTALDAALAAGLFRVENPPLGEDAELFGRLTRMLGRADASCIATAKRLEADLAADDQTFLREAEAALPLGQTLLGTEVLLAEAVRAKLLSLGAGDALLAELARLRYRPKVQNLQELM